MNLFGPHPCPFPHINPWILSCWGSRSVVSGGHTPLSLIHVGKTKYWDEELFNQPTLMHSFLYSLTICLLHYYPRHVSSINVPIFRRKNCIRTESGIFALCKRLHSTLVESGKAFVLNMPSLVGVEPWSRKLPGIFPSHLIIGWSVKNVIEKEAQWRIAADIGKIPSWI